LKWKNTTISNQVGGELKGESGKQRRESIIQNRDVKFFGIDGECVVLWSGVGKKKHLHLENWYYG